jgi:PST family polysaccharide transporter
MLIKETEERADRYFRVDHLRANLGRRTARGGAIMVGSQSLKFVISMASTVVLARLLTPQDYGLIGMVVVVTGFISLFKSMGLSAATIQQQEINDQQVSTLFWINFALGVATMLLAALVAPLIALFYHVPQLTWITMTLAAGFLFSGLTVQHEALLKRQMRFFALAAIEISALVLSLALAIILAWRGAGYWALVGSQLMMAVAQAAGVWIACRWRPIRPVRNSGIRSMLAFGRNVTGNTIFNYFSRNLDNLLIGRVWGAQQLGLYAKAYQLLLLPIEQTAVPLDGVALTALSRLADTPERYRQAYLRMLEKLAMLTMPGIAFMIVTSDWLVRVMLGPQWSETALIFALLGIVGLVEPIGNTMGWLLISQGRSRHILQVGLMDGVIAVVSIAAGLPWGAVGVAASYSIVGLCLRKPLVFWFVCRVGPVRLSDFYRAIAPAACATLCVLAALFLFRRWVQISGPLVGLPICFAIAVGVAFLALAVLPAGRTALRDAASFLPMLTKAGKPAQP